jgi:hypothetical protein
MTSQPGREQAGAELRTPGANLAGRRQGQLVVAGQHPGLAGPLLPPHAGVLAPFAWMLAADVTAVVAHLLAPPRLALAAAAVACAAAGIGIGWRFRPASNRSVPATLYAWAAWAAGSAWTLAAAAITPFGPYGLAQVALVAGGSLTAAPFLYSHWRQWRRAAPRPTPAPPGGAPRTDRRVAQFSAAFGGPGRPLAGTVMENPRPVPDGWQAELDLPRAQLTTDDVIRLQARIASLYGVPADQVIAEHTPGRQANRARLTVLESALAFQAPNVWDGRSSYDPVTGTIVYGQFADSQPARFRLHVPRSGACHSLLSGTTGSGKSATFNITLGEASLARQCAVCGPRGICDQCQPERVCGIWLADPQRQSLPHWTGCVDVTALGPLASLVMLRAVHQAVLNRSGYLSRYPWTDARGRSHTGKGWFDPEPSMPMLMAVLDEAPLLIRHPEYGKEATWRIGEIGKAGRKAGIGLMLATQLPDLSQLGEQVVRAMMVAFNAVCLKTGDPLSAAMVGISGDPFRLPMIPGLGYINSYDQRPGAAFKVKYLPEVDETGHGPDAYDIAQAAKAAPVTFDEAVRQAGARYGLCGGGQVFADEDLPGYDRLPLNGSEPAAVAARPPPAAHQPDPAREVARAIAAAGRAEIYDVMEVTGLSALDASRGLDSLIAAGQAIQDSDGRYITT